MYEANGHKSNGIRRWVTVLRDVIDEDRIPMDWEYGKPVYAYDKLDAIVQNTLINGADYTVVGEAIETVRYIKCDKYGPINFLN